MLSLKSETAADITKYSPRWVDNTWVESTGVESTEVEFACTTGWQGRGDQLRYCTDSRISGTVGAGSS